MNPRHADAFRVGLVTLVGLGGLFAVLVWIKDVDLSPRRHIRAVFPDVARLTMGDQVRVNGVPVGKVVTISLVPYEATEGLAGEALEKARHWNETVAGKVAIEAVMAGDVRLSRQARVTVASAGMLGANYLKISQAPLPEGQSTDVLEDGALVMGEVDPSLESALSEAQRFLADTRAIIEPLAKVLADPKTRQSAGDIAANLKATSEHVLALSQRLAEAAPSVTANVSQTASNFRALSEDARVEGRETLGKVRDLTRELTALATDTRGAVTRTTGALETFAGDLTAQGKTAAALKKLVASLEALTRGLEDDGRTARGVRETVADARAAAGDIKMVAATARGLATDSGLTGEVRGTIASVSALAGTAREIKDTVGKIHGSVTAAATTALDHGRLTRGDLIGQLDYDEKYYLVLGAEDLTRGHGVNTAQAGFGLGGDTTFRAGTIFDHFGMGLDHAFFRKALTASVEAFRLGDPVYRFLLLYRLAGGLELKVNVEDLSHQTTTYGGLAYRF